MSEISHAINGINKFLIENFELEHNKELLLETIKDSIKFANDITNDSANGSATLSTNKIAC